MIEDTSIYGKATRASASKLTLKKLGIAAATTMFVGGVIGLAFATKLSGPQVLMSHEISLLAVAFTAVIGLVALIGNVVVAARIRIAATFLLVAALVFAFVQPVILFASIAIDRFMIFELGYQITFSIGLPLLSALVVFLLQWFGHCLGWLGTLGFVIWVLCLGLLHLGLVIQISYSV